MLRRQRERVVVVERCVGPGPLCGIAGGPRGLVGGRRGLSLLALPQRAFGSPPRHVRRLQLTWGWAEMQDAMSDRTSSLRAGLIEGAVMRWSQLTKYSRQRQHLQFGCLLSLIGYSGCSGCRSQGNYYFASALRVYCYAFPCHVDQSLADQGEA